MGLRELDNLVRINQLKAERADRGEFEGLVRRLMAFDALAKNFDKN